MSERQDEPAGWPSNNPPLDEEDPLLKIDVLALVDAKRLPAALKLNYQQLYDRKEALLNGIDDWIEDHLPPRDKRSPLDPKVKPQVGDEQDLKDTTDFASQVKDFLRDEVEATRKKVKGPIDKAGAEIQKFFVKDMADELSRALIPIVDAQGVALAQKLERERQRLREEAWEAAQLADRLAIQARRATGVRQSESLLQKAMEVEDEAARLERAAEGSVADLTRTRTDLQQVTGLKSNWKFDVVNLIELVMEIAAGRLPIEWVTIDEVYANGKIRPKDGVRSVPGLHIHEEIKPR